MDKNIIKQMIEYIELTDGTMNKMAAIHQGNLQRYREGLASSIDKLAEMGVIDRDNVGSLFDSMKNAPEKAAEFMAITAKAPAKTIGSKSDRYNSNALDPIARFALGY